MAASQEASSGVSFGAVMVNEGDKTLFRFVQAFLNKINREPLKCATNELLDSSGFSVGRCNYVGPLSYAKEARRIAFSSRDFATLRGQNPRRNQSGQSN
jgi:hypothetical protein